MGFFDRFRARCPRCQRPGLRMMQFLRATITIDGKRAPAAFAYLLCPHCDARLRQDNSGPIVEADPDDWQREVPPDLPAATVRRRRQ